MIKIILIVFGLFFILLILITKKRNKRLDNWAKSVPISEAQQNAMKELWDAHNNNRVPEVDPLSNLTKEDLEYVKLICSADFRPKEFGSANSVRLALYFSLKEKGYSFDQAAIIIGMSTNRVGRKDI